MASDRKKYLEIAQQMLDTGKTQQATQNTLARKPMQQKFLEQVGQMAPQLGMTPDELAKSIQDSMAGIQVRRGPQGSVGQPEIMRGGSAGATFGEPEIVSSGLPSTQAEMMGHVPPSTVDTGEAIGSGDAIESSPVQADDMLGGAGMIRSLYKHLAGSLGEKAAAAALAKIPWHEVNPAFKGKVSPSAVMDFLRGEQSAAGNARHVWSQAAKMQPEIDAMPSFAHNAEGLLGDLGLGEITPSGASAATKPFKVPTK